MHKKNSVSKKVAVSQLRPGMFIDDFNCSWLEHPFAGNRLLVSSYEEIVRIKAAGIAEVYIDPQRGIDVQDAPTRDEVNSRIESEFQRMAREPVLVVASTLEQEMPRAARIRDRAVSVVREMMSDVRLGHAIGVPEVEETVHAITDSVTRNASALASLLQVKNKDDYTFVHSVSVGTLMVAFARHLGEPQEQVLQVGLGGMLHDVGKALVPDAVLNKPGRLTEEEFEVIRRHPADGHALLCASGEVGPVPLVMTRHHHERMDGSGYPDRLAGEQIDRVARMAAIVDIYDALTSERCYHSALSPAEALRKMYGWSDTHLDRQLMQAFIRCVGIYPVGSLVMLESGRLAVVSGQNPAQLLTPVVTVFFSSRSNTYVRPERLDLSQGGTGVDRIVGAESPEKWRVDPHRFLSVEGTGAA